MIVGTVKEIKNHECRVGLTPESASEIAAHASQASGLTLFILAVSMRV